MFFLQIIFSFVQLTDNFILFLPGLKFFEIKLFFSQDEPVPFLAELALFRDGLVPLLASLLLLVASLFFLIMSLFLHMASLVLFPDVRRHFFCLLLQRQPEHQIGFLLLLQFFFLLDQLPPTTLWFLFYLFFSFFIKLFSFFFV